MNFIRKFLFGFITFLLFNSLGLYLANYNNLIDFGNFESIEYIFNNKSIFLPSLLVIILLLIWSYKLRTFSEEQVEQKRRNNDYQNIRKSNAITCPTCVGTGFLPKTTGSKYLTCYTCGGVGLLRNKLQVAYSKGGGGSLIVIITLLLGCSTTFLFNRLSLIYNDGITFKRLLQGSLLLISITISILYYRKNWKKFPTVNDKIGFFTGTALAPPTACEFLI